MDVLPRPLLLSTLPEDVLHDILACILTDTTDSSRAGVLRVCQSFHEAGEGFLYRDVRVERLEDWQQLFGSRPDGMLTVEGGRDLARHVRQLTLGARNDDGWGPSQRPSFRMGEIQLDGCNHLRIDAFPLVRFSGIADFFAPLFRNVAATVISFINVTDIATYRGRRDIVLDVSPEEVFGFPASGRLGTRFLRSVHFDGVILNSRTSNPDHPSDVRRSAPVMNDWNVGTVVIDFGSFPEEFLKEGWHPLASSLGHALFQTKRGYERSGERAFAGWRRVELRVGRMVEMAFRTSYGPERGTSWFRRFTSPEDKHLASLIVFVDEDGHERKLIQ